MEKGNLDKGPEGYRGYFIINALCIGYERTSGIIGYERTSRTIGYERTSRTIGYVRTSKSPRTTQGLHDPADGGSVKGGILGVSTKPLISF